MPDPRPTVPEREDLLSSDRTIRAFFHRLRSRLRPQSFFSDKSHEPSVKGKWSIRPISQQTSSKKATASQQSGLTDRDTSVSGSKRPVASTFERDHDKPHQSSQERKSSVTSSLSHFPSPPAPYGESESVRIDGFNGAEASPGVKRRTRSVSRSSAKSLPDKRKFRQLEKKYSRMSLSNEPRETPTVALPRDATRKHSRIDEEPNEKDERERTLRILESKDSPVTHRSSSPATIRRHRRSYQLATDPHIEPQQYSNFLKYLEQEITTDIALRLQIWKSLTGDSGNRAASLMDLDTTGNLLIPEDTCYTDRRVQRPGINGYDKPRKISGSMYRRPRSCNSVLGGKKESLQVCDHSSTPENNKTRGQRKSIVSARLGHIDLSEKAALQRSNPQKRQSWPQQGITQKKDPDRKRESTSSFAQVISQYIRPEMPRTIYKESQCQSCEVPAPDHKEIST
ncbi:hypothetical protein F4805DRAFT_463456 [Annulohypoxylon moriforme]|nr:hypothetical protein F4805DRAFT_463456 [Annulohypoxylon moriforme]